ncbi:YdcF family protein [Cereibacter sphaeroides]|uniref:YdcF family protein n=1 Tax=Cereibacter sphaeroides TaxID=1063 RepID=UPI000191CBDA|nr:YdcF family protein [Cereibacter sphaeroides]ACM03428.1 Hypothetical Protein RSKD131_3568 [Cereibacter sphaeroides KD131]
MDTIFFIASKLVWILVRPETLLVLAVAAGLAALVLRRLRLAAALLLSSCLAFLAVGALPLSYLALSSLERVWPADPPVGEVAGIILLGGSEDAAAARKWRRPAVTEAGDRYLATIALARRFPEARVLFTGGSGRLFGAEIPEARIAREILVSAGVDPARLILEGQSRNTAENAHFAKALVANQGQGSWLLVTSAFHMPRAVETFCAAGWQDLVPWPTDYRTASLRDGIGWDLARNLDLLNVAVREWIGILAYRVTGRAVTARCTRGG